MVKRYIDRFYNKETPGHFDLSNGSDVYGYYNADGQRVLKESSSGSWTFYVMDGQQTLAVIEDGTFSHFNLVGNSTFGRWEPGGTRRYYITDHLGSTRAVVDDGGTVLETFDYYPFGLLMPKRNTAGANTLEKFTGKERDNEGGLNLDYFGARYYDAAISRWLSRDPLASKYPSLSSYNYVANNPVNALDPDGRVVVFINGRHDLNGNPDRRAMNQLWGNTDDRLMSSYFKGEHAVYRDGSNYSHISNLFPGQRLDAGRKQSNTDYNKILSHARDERKRGLSGTVKLFTHSMGAAYGRGYAMGLLKTHAESESSEELTIEFIVDIAPFQESDLPNIDGVDIFHASDGDPLSDGRNPRGSQQLGVTSISSEDYMHISHHQLQSYDPDEIMGQIYQFLNESN